MTEPNQPNSPEARDAAQRALHQLATDSNDAVALGTLAASEVLVPVPENVESPDGEPGGIQLPVFEQSDGVRLVPVFTSEERLAVALPQIHSYRMVQLALLGQGWPADDLALSIDAGSPDTLTVQGRGVRALATLTGGG
ncbi:SseB family protein [Streptantibioticus rubrisoli]|uniref:SseB family protein n=1 Tax=Streptantibioticus rubrisoli TaxID=1387313 RepID=A0ABT1PLF2_9ACTN|nr:SseB family protein [Streptantibioticus rubrisoli]MCQ4046180.1 SseB family protein [Streptantibioticus rubrisoli]